MTVVDVLSWLVAGVVLGFLLWSLVVLVKARFVDKGVVIAPFHVTGLEDPDGRLGRTLALMLQSRDRWLQREFDASQRWLVTSEGGGEVPGPDTAVADVRDRALVDETVERPISTEFAVLPEPPQIDLKVGGIEFGGAARWLYRRAAQRRTLTFAAHFGQDGRALVTASLDALGDGGPRARRGRGRTRPRRAVSTRGGAARPDGGPSRAARPPVPRDLWLDTSTEPDEMATALAYALLQVRMAGTVDAIDALTLVEFRTLLENLSRLADLNRRVGRGRARDVDALHEVLGGLHAVLETVREWPGLLSLAAQVAEEVDATDQALGLYGRLHDLCVRWDADDPRASSDLCAIAAEKVAALGAAKHGSSAARERRFVDAVRAYERRLRLDPPHPEIVFMEEPPTFAGLRAQWDDERRRYEVNPDSAADPALEMEKHAALDGRFMARHYDRCQPGTGPAWNEFRLPVVEFVVATEGTAYQPALHRRYPLYEALQALGRSGDLETVRQLALRLIDRYDCDWTADDLPDRVAGVAAELGLTGSAVREAFTEPVAAVTAPSDDAGSGVETGPAPAPT